jgi:hypothetical protein
MAQFVLVKSSMLSSDSVAKVGDYTGAFFSVATWGVKVFGLPSCNPTKIFAAA